MLFNQISGDQGILVFPDAKHRPTRVTERRVNFGVATDVAIHLLDPVVHVAARLSVVHGTPMPKAAVDEHGHPCPSKHHIRSSTNTRERPSGYAVSQAASVQDRPKDQLRLGVPAAISLHRLSGSRGGHI